MGRGGAARRGEISGVRNVVGSLSAIRAKLAHTRFIMASRGEARTDTVLAALAALAEPAAGESTVTRPLPCWPASMELDPEYEVTVVDLTPLGALHDARAIDHP